MRLGIIDYGVGNLGSIARALEELRVDAPLLDQPSQLANVDRIILPGVGNFTECMERLAEGGWLEPLREAVDGQGKYLLGVCVGMQLLADYGSEGSSGGLGTPGLGFVPGRVDHLGKLGCDERVPHVGWNAISVAHHAEGLFAGIPEGTDFYFVHSYAFVPAEPEYTVASANYGVAFTVAVGKGKVWGTQFHPEKSSRAGFAVLRNFTALH